MPLVQIKGTNEQIRFPDDISEQEMLRALRAKYNPAMSPSMTPSEMLQGAMNAPNQLQPYDRSISERIKYGIGDALQNSGIISNNQGAYQIGDNLGMAVESLPFVGGAVDADEFKRAYDQGDILGMGLSSLGFVPGIGEAGQAIFGGVLARNINPEMLNKAKKSLESGSSSKYKVYQDTGFFEGADGKLRFEIDDSKSKIDMDAFNSAPVSVESPEGTMEASGNLMDFLEHDELYEQYPELAYRPVIITDSFDAKGAYFEEPDVILLNKSLLNSPEEIKSTLLHELQHSVQARENFARGGNSDIAFTDRMKQGVLDAKNSATKNFDRWMDKNAPLVSDYKEKARLAHEALKYKSIEKLTEYANHPEPTRLKRLIGQETGWLYSSEFQNVPELRRAAQELDREWYNLPKAHKKKERAEFLRNHAFNVQRFLRDTMDPDTLQMFKSDPRKLNSMVKALERDVDSASKKLEPMRRLEGKKRDAETLNKANENASPYMIYKNLAGEAEARNVQDRINMTAEERLSSFPKEDVPRENQIVRFNNTNLIRVPSKEDIIIDKPQNGVLE